MEIWYTKCLLLSLIVPFVICATTNQAPRDEKLISTFQVVRFPNDGCVGSNNRNGTCYTSQECSSKSGTSSGSCADGFGVCCTFIINTCGKSSSENLTVWTQPATIPTGVCSLDVIPVSDNICSLRLDFTTFAITGPSTITIVQGRRRLGQASINLPDTLVQEGVSFSTNCFVDAFYAQGPSPSTNPPVICGTNTNQHMYVEADVDRGNRLMFSLADASITYSTLTISRGIGSPVTRTWDMTISHIECSSMTVPPAGCTKYFWNAAGKASLSNYNYVSGTDALANIHLAQQHERMCVRRERGKCVGCFSALAVGTFDISITKEHIAGNLSAPTGCCGYATTINFLDPTIITQAGIGGNGYGGDNVNQFGWDCVIIPGAFMLSNDAIGAYDFIQSAAEMKKLVGDANHMNIPSGPQICGSGAGIGPGMESVTRLVMDTAEGAILDEGEASHATICTRHQPFTLEFMSDDLEGQGLTASHGEFNSATQAINQGFNIILEQMDCATS